MFFLKFYEFIYRIAGKWKWETRWLECDQEAYDLVQHFGGDADCIMVKCGRRVLVDD